MNTITFPTLGHVVSPIGSLSGSLFALAATARVGSVVGRALSLLAAFALLLSLPAFAADPAEGTTNVAASAATAPTLVSTDTTKAALTGDASPHQESFLSKMMKQDPRTGGVDPHVDSWQSILNSIRQFGNPLFVLRLFLSLTLAVACAWAIAWHPRRSSRVDPLSDLEECKTFVVLGVVGAVVAELSGTSQTLAFVIFGIGALLRFRTLLDNPKATGKAILVVVIGLACGMGSWTMAVFVTAFSWVLLYWLDSKAGCIIRIRLDGESDPKPVYTTVESLLVSRGCQIQSFTMSKGKRRLEFLLHMPAGLDPKALQAELKAKLPKVDESRINVRLM